MERTAIMSKKYKLKSLADCVQLTCNLPPDRSQVFLQELVEYITYVASMARVAKSLGAKTKFTGEMLWVDDDKREVTANIAISIRGTPT
jgi:hypothetical protein